MNAIQYIRKLEADIRAINEAIHPNPYSQKEHDVNSFLSYAKEFAVQRLKEAKKQIELHLQEPTK